MTRIGPDGVDALAAIIRRQVGSLARPAGAATPTAALAGEARSRRKMRGGDLAAVVARRVRAVDPADPDAHAKAFQVFLESVLLAEFGDHLINDPAFHQLVQSLYHQMASAPELAEMMRRASATLLGQAAR